MAKTKKKQAPTKAGADYKAEPMEWVTAHMTVSRKWEFNEEMTPDERRVWLAAATSLALTGADNTRWADVAALKGRYADAMLEEYRKRFLRPVYSVDIQHEDGKPVDPKMAERARGFATQLADTQAQVWWKAAAGDGGHHPFEIGSEPVQDPEAFAKARQARAVNQFRVGDRVRMRMNDGLSQPPLEGTILELGADRLVLKDINRRLLPGQLPAFQFRPEDWQILPAGGGLMHPAVIASTAKISEDGRYRYSLERVLAVGSNDRMLFIMLNPSTADEVVDDPTICRCIGFAMREGHGLPEVVNLYALRSPNPEMLRTTLDPVGGPRNKAAITRAVMRARTVVYAWGNHGAPHVWRAVHDEVVLPSRHRPACLGQNKNGQPRHPLYIRADQPLIPFVVR